MITNKDLFYVRMLSKIAKNMSNDLRCQHAACLTIDKKIVSLGSNKKKTAPLQQKYLRDDRKDPSFIHAEVDALKHVEKLVDNQRHTMYVVRVDDHGKLANSKPCEGCARLLKDRNIDRIVHSVNGGLVEYFLKDEI